MKTVPFLNEKGEQVGTATISDDGIEADITISADYEVLKSLRDMDAVSMGYYFTSGDAQPLKDDGRRLFAVQKIGHKFVPSNPRNLCNVCGVLKHNHKSQEK